MSENTDINQTEWTDIMMSLRCHYDVTHQGIHCVLTEGDHKQSVVQVPYGGTLPNLIVKLNKGEKTVLQKVCLTCTSHSHKIHCFK